MSYQKLKAEILNGNVEAAEKMIQEGGDLAALEKIDHRYKGLMNLALTKGHLAMISMLIKHQACLDFKDGNGWTSLMSAVTASKTNMPDQLKIVELLLEHGASASTRHMDEFPHMKFYLGWSLMHLATEEGNLDVVKNLMKHGLSLEVADRSGGRTLLHTAIENNEFEMVKWLIEQGLDPMVKNLDGETAVDVAAKFRLPYLESYLTEIIQVIQEQRELEKITEGLQNKPTDLHFDPTKEGPSFTKNRLIL